MAQTDRLYMGLVASTTPALVIGGLTNLSCPPGPQVIFPRSVGVDPEMAAVMASRPRMLMSSRHIATVLGSVGVSGLSITSNLIAYFQKQIAFGTRTTAAAESVQFADAYLLPRRISASQDSLATIDLEALALSADGTDPVTLSDSATMPGTGAVSELYTIGPVSINATKYDLETGELDFGIGEEVDASDGFAYPTQMWIGSRNAQFRFASKTAYALTNTGISGEELTAFSWYLRKLEANKVRIADATAEHIKFTCTGYVHIDDLSGDPSTKANTSVVVTPVAGVITISAASAIT